MNTSKKCMAILFSSLFVFNSIILDLVVVNKAEATDSVLPAPNSLCEISADYSMPELVGLAIGDSAYDLSLLFDSNDTQIVEQDTVEEAMNYFLAALSMPAEKMWVNLSPYEQNRVIDQDLAKTDLGKGFLDQDYVLKLFSATLTNPETDLGKEYWQNNGLLNNLSKVWITPKSAAVYEQANKVLITKSELAAEARTETEESKVDSKILSVIENELNQGENFAKMRQIYNAVILARWFKNKIKNSVLSSYANSAVVKGIDNQSAGYQEQVWKQYCKSFEEGVYNKIIKETKNNKKQKRQYIAGGVIMPEFEITNSTLNQFEQKGQLYSSNLAFESASSSIGVKDKENKKKFNDEYLGQNKFPSQKETFKFRASFDAKGILKFRVNGSKYALGMFGLKPNVLEFLKSLDSSERIVEVNIINNAKGQVEFTISPLFMAKVPRHLLPYFEANYEIGDWNDSAKRRSLIRIKDSVIKKRIAAEYLDRKEITKENQKTVFYTSVSVEGVVAWAGRSLRPFGKSNKLRGFFETIPKEQRLVRVEFRSYKPGDAEFEFEFILPESADDALQNDFKSRRYLSKWDEDTNKRDLLTAKNKFAESYLFEAKWKSRKLDLSFKTILLISGNVKFQYKLNQANWRPFTGLKAIEKRTGDRDKSGDDRKIEVKFQDDGNGNVTFTSTLLDMNDLDDAEKELFERSYKLGKWNKELEHNEIIRIEKIKANQELINYYLAQEDMDRANRKINFETGIDEEGTMNFPMINGNRFKWKPFTSKAKVLNLIKRLDKKDRKVKVNLVDKGSGLVLIFVELVSLKKWQEKGVFSATESSLLKKQQVLMDWMPEKKRRPVVCVDHSKLSEVQKVASEFENDGLLELVNELSYYPDELSMLLSVFTDYSDDDIAKNLAVYSELSLHEYQEKKEEIDWKEKSPLGVLLRALDNFDSSLEHMNNSQYENLFNIAFKVALRTLSQYEDNLGEITKLFNKLKTKKKKVKDFFNDLELKVQEALKEIDLINPKHITIALRPHQKFGVYMARKNAAFANFNQPRTGKTLEALASLDPSKKNTVICPARLINNWKNEVESYTTFKNVSVINGGLNIEQKNKVLSKISKTREGQLIILSVESALRDPSYDLSIIEKDLDTVIFDEAQFFSNYFGEDSAKNSIQALNAQKFKAKKKLILSATPFHSKLEQLYALYTMLFPEEPMTKTEFKNRYLIDTSSQVKLYMKLGQKSTRVILKDVFQVYDESMTDEEKKLSIPRVDVEKIYISMTYKQSEDLLKLLRDKESENKKGPLSYWEIKQRAEDLWLPVIKTESGYVADESSPAWQALDDYVAPRIEKAKGIIFAYNLKQMQAMRKRYEKYYGKDAVAMMNGDTTMANELDKFKGNDGCRVLIMSVFCGDGIDVSEASWVTFAQLPEYFSQFNQNKGRAIGANPIYIRPNVDIGFIIPIYHELLKEIYADDDGANEYLEAGSMYAMNLLRLEMEEMQFLKTIGGAQVNPTISRLVKNTVKFKEAQKRNHISSSALALFENEEVRGLIEHISANWSSIVEKGAFAFDVSQTLVPILSKIEPEVADLLAKLLIENVRIAIVTGESKKPIHDNLVEPVSLALQDKKALLENMTIYYGSGSNKLVYSNGIYVEDAKFAEKNILPREIKLRLANVLKTVVSSNFYLNEQDLNVYMDEWGEWMSTKFPSINYQFGWVNNNSWQPKVYDVADFWARTKNGDLLDIPCILTVGSDAGYNSLYVLHLPETGYDVRPKVQELFKSAVQDLDLDIYTDAGGMSAIDVLATTSNKAEALWDYINVNGLDNDNVYFFGDQFFKKSKHGNIYPGNDEYIAMDKRLAGVRTLSVAEKEPVDSEVSVHIGSGYKSTGEFLKKVLSNTKQTSSPVNGGVEMDEFAIEGFGASSAIDSVFENVDLKDLGAFSFDIKSIKVEESVQAWLNHI